MSFKYDTFSVPHDDNRFLFCHSEFTICCYFGNVAIRRFTEDHWIKLCENTAKMGYLNLPGLVQVQIIEKINEVTLQTTY